MSDIVPAVLCHHERMDGTGYPAGLKGDQIPLIGRIVMIADSFDAMTSKRAYRNAMDIETALEEMEKGLGTQFDERIGRIFIKYGGYELWKILQDGMIERAGRTNFSEYGTLAVGSLLR
jgi:HD-GYP domain-containing protein (c-di-GMP phosphodiesterase class II)